MSEVLKRCSREAVAMSLRAGEVAEVRLFPVSLLCLSHSLLFYFLSSQMVVDMFRMVQINRPAYGFKKRTVPCGLLSWVYDD